MTDAELIRLMELASAVPPNGIIVEVGCLYGLSSWHIAKACKPGVILFCIDPWKRERWIVNLVEKPQNGPHFSRRSFEQYTADCNNIVMIQGYSPRIASGWNLPVDLYVEDAVHTNPVLSSNISFWSKRVKPGGVICGHDYVSQWPHVIAEADRLASYYRTTLEVVDTLWSVVKSSDNIVVEPSGVTSTHLLEKILRLVGC